ncbi:MAG TPA: STN domain-containing protein, partial [Steroidobacteraceae bacterium]|nr:STN domain-containing protein [Steroidobacteraceae bacterium]
MLGQRFIYGVLVLALTLSRSLACTPDENVKCFDIPAQSLTDALDRFSEQSGLQVIYEHSLIADATGAEVSGALPVDAALDRLLGKTDIAWEYVNARTILFRRSSAASDDRGSSRDRTPADSLSGDGVPVQRLG